jgi:hypothetical protein
MSNFIVSLIDGLRRKPKLLGGIFLFILGAVLLFDFTAERHAAHFFGDNVRGFWTLFGLLGCLGMTKFMKWIGHDVLMKPLDFYSRHESGEE